MNAIDTNVLVYAHDADEPIKQSKAAKLLSALVQQPGETLLLWQVAGEFLSCLRKWESSGKMLSADVHANFQDVLTMFDLRVPTLEVFKKSFELSSRFSLSHWDSMLLAACKDASVDTLYSEDFDAGTDYDGARVINPFV
jgi:predicted nucleic acid-binding protein